MNDFINIFTITVSQKGRSQEENLEGLYLSQIADDNNMKMVIFNNFNDVSKNYVKSK